MQKQKKVAHLTQHLTEIRSPIARPNPVIEQNIYPRPSKETEQDVSGGNMEPDTGGVMRKTSRSKTSSRPNGRPNGGTTGSSCRAASHTTTKLRSTEGYTAMAGRIENMEWSRGMGTGIIYHKGAPRTLDIIGIG